MKRILFLVVALLLLFTLAGCDDESDKPAIKDEIGEIEEEANEEAPVEVPEEEVKPEAFYTGVVCQLPSSGTSPFTALKTDGTYDKLGERGVYGYPETTDDGKYVFFRQSVDGVERLFVMTPNERPFELAGNASDFILDDAGKWVAARCKDGFYFATDFTKPCEKIVDMDSVKSILVSEDGKKATLLDDEKNLYFVDIESKTYALIDSSVEFVIKRICENLVYYAKEDGLYEYKNASSAFVSDWWLSTDFPEIFATGTERERSYHYINSDGTVFDIEDEISVSSYTKMSKNNKYFVTGSGKTLYRYEVTPTGLINKTELLGNGITIYNINNDGVVLACSSKDQSFGIFENGEYKKLSDGMLLVNHMGYSSCVHFGNGCVYFLNDGVLYRYTFGGEVEVLAENVYSIAANGDYCYYTANYNKSSQKGDVYAVGSEEAADDAVMYIFAR